MPKDTVKTSVHIVGNLASDRPCLVITDAEVNEISFYRQGNDITVNESISWEYWQNFRHAIDSAFEDADRKGVENG